MKIIVFSLTGNCKRFVDMCKIPEEDVIDLWDIDYEVVEIGTGVKDSPMLQRLLARSIMCHYL